MSSGNDKVLFVLSVARLWSERLLFNSISRARIRNRETKEENERARLEVIVQRSSRLACN